MNEYPEIVTERFDSANFHIKYCLKFMNKYLKGNILEVGAGCGSFTKHYQNKEITSITLTELDQTNILNLNKKFDSNKKIKIIRKNIDQIEEKFDVIIYLHVLEHIKHDQNEINEASKRLNKNGVLIIMVPAHQKMYSNLDRAVGHFRRYETDFFKEINLKVENNILKIEISENPIIEDIQINGLKNKKFEKELLGILSLNNRNPYVESMHLNDINYIKNFTKRSGYYFATVKTSQVNNDLQNTVQLIYDIDLGDRAKIKKNCFYWG